MTSSEWQAAPDRRHPRRSLRILVVDDDRDTVETLTLILREEGHMVLGVYAGTDVLPSVRFYRPDVVILDIAIPGMSGYAAAQAIRNSFTEFRRPLMIAASGLWKETADQRVAEQVGFDHHLAKPYVVTELLALLEPLRGPLPPSLERSDLGA